MKLILTALALTFSINALAVTYIGSLLENQQILEFIAKEKDNGYHLTSVLDRLSNEGITEDQRGARGHYLIKLKKIEFIDTEDGDVEKKESNKKFDVRTDFGRVQKIEEIVEAPTESNTDVISPPSDGEE
ncbi:MAG: hypothetical protein CME70_05050 [Halobacteriovorax sp.]|nr:hypothetical protein [Halobacteriovorax sp.]